MKSIGIVGRSVTVLAMAMALTIGGASLASASSFHSRWGGGNFASGKVSGFDYAGSGTGGYVTAVTSTSVTVQSWNGTSTTYALTPTTTYTEGKTTSTTSPIVVGDRVEIGVSSTSSTTASSVTIELAMLFGTVTTVSGNTITIRDPQGFTRTIVVNPTATTYSLSDGGTATLASVVTGAKIIAQGTIDTNGTSLDALSVEIGTSGQIDFTYGTVTAVTSSTVTILAKDGTSTTFTYSTSTDVKALGDGSATLTTTDLAVGEHAGVSYDSSAATTAVTIYIKLAHISGTVTNVTGDNITVQDHQGFTRLVLVGDATTYSAQGGGTATLVSVVAGVRIRAEGIVDTNGTTLDALTVVICTPKTTTNPLPNPQIPGGRHHHHGGFGNGGGFGGFGGGSQESSNNRF
jgi:Domain of unknown function (DUF5666)